MDSCNCNFCLVTSVHWKTVTVNTNHICLALFIMLLALPLGITRAEPAESHIAVYMSREAAPYQNTLAGFKQYLKEKNWQGSLKVISLKSGDNSLTESPVSGAENQAPDLVFTLGESALERATQESPGTPIVAGMVLDSGKIKQAPNTTGVALDFPVATQLDWLRRILPKAYSVGVLYNPRVNEDRINLARQEAQKIDLRIVSQTVSSPQELPGALKQIEREANVLWGVPDETVLAPQTAKQILLFSYRNRIPFIGLSKAWVKAGALYALDRDYVDIGEQCGEIAVRILQGTPVTDIPVVPPRKILFSVNAKTAKHMKIELPADLLSQAQKVY